MFSRNRWYDWWLRFVIFKLICSVARLVFFGLSSWSQEEDTVCVSNFGFVPNWILELKLDPASLIFFIEGCMTRCLRRVRSLRLNIFVRLRSLGKDEVAPGRIPYGQLYNVPHSDVGHMASLVQMHSITQTMRSATRLSFAGEWGSVVAATFAFFHRGLNGASYAVAGLHQGPHGEGAATVFDTFLVVTMMVATKAAVSSKPQQPQQ